MIENKLQRARGFVPLQRLGFLIREKFLEIQQISDAGCLQELKVPTHGGG